ncbi:MAG: energy transducer TonB [Spirochaetales bacterium]|nr:energy transducer TonB [Spirochaetales bacterium]
MNRTGLIVCIVISALLHVVGFVYISQAISPAAHNASKGIRYASMTYVSPSENLQAESASMKNISALKTSRSAANSQKSKATTTREATSIDQYMTRFAMERDRLIRRIEQNKTYPIAARKPGKEIEGSVGMRLSLDEQGNMISVEVIKSSGSSILDWAAKDLVQKVVPFRHSLDSRFVCEFSVGYWLK